MEFKLMYLQNTIIYPNEPWRPQFKGVPSLFQLKKYAIHTSHEL